MRFSDFGIALIAMAGSANAQWKGNPAMKLKDVRPGHIEDMEALHKSIVSPHRTSAHPQTTANQNTYQTTATLRLKHCPHTMDTLGKTTRPLLRLVGRKMAPATTRLHRQSLPFRRRRYRYR
jgi:hypothetical protein